MHKIINRSCPRCDGRLFIDVMENEEFCLTCGYRQPMTEFEIEWTKRELKVRR